MATELPILRYPRGRGQDEYEFAGIKISRGEVDYLRGDLLQRLSAAFHAAGAEMKTVRTRGLGIYRRAEAPRPK